MAYKSTLISILLTTAILFIVWMTFLSSQREKFNLVKTDLLPDAYMEEVTAVIMNKYGKPSMKLSTPKLVHFSENDMTQFTSPTLTLYRQSPAPWYIISNRATATQGIENIDFKEDVIIHHAADVNNPATLIKTDTLTVYPNQHIAKTVDLITMTQANLIVKAIGMLADMNTGDIKLLSQARGEYAPNS